MRWTIAPLILLIAGCGSAPQAPNNNFRVEQTNVDSVGDDLQRIVVLASAPSTMAELDIDADNEDDVRRAIDDLGRIKSRFPSSRAKRQIERSFSTLVDGLSDNSVPVDITRLIQFILREAYLAEAEDLSYYAEKVSFYNEKKKALRDHVAEMRKYQDVLSTEVHQDWANEMTKLEGELVAMGEDAQLANLRLQEALQKQQQTYQLISNVSKMLHDAARNVISNIR